MPLMAQTTPAEPTQIFAVPAIVLGTANAEGVAASGIRSDATIALFDATAPTSSAVGDAAAVGTAALAARRDHTHGREAFATPAFVLGTSNAGGDATTPVRSNATIALFDATNPVDQAFGDAAATGTAAIAARRDHVHGMPNVTLNANTNNNLATMTGTANTLQGEANLTFDGTTLTLGQGQIAFPATQNASAGANVLDDYEEGTFTPAIADDTLSGAESQTYSRQVGRYTKIGNLVYITLRLTITSLGTLTTTQQARIIGLPFTSENVANSNSAVNIGNSGGLALTTASEVATGLVTVNATDIQFFIWDATTGTGTWVLSEVTGAGDLILSGCYRV